MIQYVRITSGLADKGNLIPHSELSEAIKDYEKDHYRSIFFYTEAHYKDFQKTNTVAGIIDVTTNLLVFDFDSKDNLEQARKDTIELCSRLIGHGVLAEQFNITYSGSKGYSIEMETTHTFNPTQLKNVALNLGTGLATLDNKIYNASRVFRVPYTKHQATGLYKLPITLQTLTESSVELIKGLAVSNTNAVEYVTHEVTLPDSVLAFKNLAPKVEEEHVTTDLSDLDLSLKPRTMPACKFAIQHGFFPSGSRSNALMALAAHYKAQGVPKEINYRILKGAAELQGRRHNQEPFDKKEIWDKIVGQVYGPNWKGKTYSCANEPWLKALCPNKGLCSKKSKEFISIDDVSDVFKSYAENIDNNTIKTGIKSIDSQIRLQTHSHVVIAGSSGSGKTSLVLNILNNCSNAGLKAVMGSMDMGAALVYQKLAHKVSGLNDAQLYNIYKNKEKAKIEDIRTKIKKQYENVVFDFRSGVDIGELRDNLLSLKDKHGNELKLVVYDFINRIRGPYSDETANLAYIAPKLSDLANETETLIISLAQTARAKGGPAAPLTDSRISKGSSAIEESATVLFGIWRPGYNQGDDDKYIRMAAVKTRMGKEFSTGLHWNGLTGEIRDLNQDETIQLEYLEAEKEDDDKKEGGW